MPRSSPAQVSLCAGAERNFDCIFLYVLTGTSLLFTHAVIVEAGGGSTLMSSAMSSDKTLKRMSVLAGHSLLEEKLLGSMDGHTNKACVYVHVFKETE